MDDPTWEQVDALFARALELDPKARAAFLDEACGGDRELRAAVEELLATDARVRDSSFLSRPAAVKWEPLWDGAARERELVSAAAADRVGERLGPWRLEGVLGRGGMATVYRARRVDGEYEQEVAVKVVGPGPAADRLIRELRAEREILSGLSHPNIARLLDGGTTEDGHPYLVMELVEGRPITLHCEAQELDLEERLDLFLEVLGAVGHAHRNLVLHQDIKPSNILVTEEGRIRLLDFGIAKLLDSEARVANRARIRTGADPLTPAYASPEQIRGQAVTTASDVYQLGILLYRLLAGCQPYRLEGSTLSELHRALDEVEIAAPSDAIGTGRTHGESREAESALRSRARRLRGDLDSITLKALSEAPGDRYPSVEAMADDLRRYLRGLPISARSPSWGYRFQKFVSRNPWRVAAGVAALVAPTAFGLIQHRNAGRLEAERDRARYAQARAEEVRDFTLSLFELADPMESRGDEVTARELLEEGARRIRGELEDQPRLRAEMLSTMADIYLNLGHPEQALALSREALDIRREVLPPADRDRAASELQVADLAARTGAADTPDGFRRAMAWTGRAYGWSSLEMADAYHLAALDAPGLSNGQRAALDDSAVAVLEGLGPEARPRLARVLVESLYYGSRGPREDSVRLWRALDIQRSIEDQGGPGTAAILGDIAMWSESRDPDRAIAFAREAVEMHRAVRGPHHPTTLTLTNNLAGMYRDRAEPGDLAAAERLYRDVLAARRKVTEDPAALAYTLYGLARVLVAQGRGEEAETHLREIRSLRVFPVDDARHAMVEIALGRALLQQERFKDAEIALDRARTGSRGEKELRRKRLEALVTLYDLWDKPADAQRVLASLAALEEGN